MSNSEGTKIEQSLRRNKENIANEPKSKIMSLRYLLLEIKKRSFQKNSHLSRQFLMVAL